MFNANVGAVAIDTASVSVTATSAKMLRELRAVTRYGDGQPDGWLTVDLDGTALPAQLTLRASTAPLSPGEYTATVQLTAPGAAAESLTVTARVVSGASIGINAAKICFTTTLGNQTPRHDGVTVSSVDGSVIDGLTATIAYDAGQLTGWLDATFNVTTAPAQLRLQGTPGTLPAGIYTATVNIASPKAGNSPVPVRVTLNIQAVQTAKLTLKLVTIGQGGAGNGRLTAPGIDCVLSNGVQGGDCEESYARGTLVHVTAVPSAGQVFYPQSCYSPGNCSETGFDISMSEDLRFDGGFGAPASTLLVTTISPDNGGLGFVEGPYGLRCVNGGCSGMLDGGVGDYPIVAYGEYGARFVRWEGACSGSAGLCTVHFDTPGTTQEVTAVFGTMPSTISQILLQGTGASGTVTFGAPVTVPGAGGPLTCRLVNGVQAGRCDGVVEAGVGTFTVTATPDPGSVFVWWLVGNMPGPLEQPVRCAETLPSCTFTFTTGGGAIDGVVTFASTSSLPLEVVIEGLGGVSWPYSGERYSQDCPTICKEYFAPGSTVTLKAFPAEHFVGWTDCPSPSAATCDVLMTEDRRVVARFAP